MATENVVSDLWVGEDWNLPLVFDPVANIGGFGLSFILKTLTGTVVLTKTLAAGAIVISDSANGVGTLTVLTADTSTLSAQKYYFEIRRTDSGENKVFAYGTINLRH